MPWDSKASVEVIELFMGSLRVPVGAFRIDEAAALLVANETWIAFVIHGMFTCLCVHDTADKDLKP